MIRRGRPLRWPVAPLIALLVAVCPAPVAADPVAATASMSRGGITASLAAKLQQKVDDERALLDAPGISAAVIMPDGSMWTGQSGWADVAAQVPVTASTTFAIASITKTFVSATVLQLVEERRIALEDPLSDWFPTWPNGTNITIRMLLSHTSGIYNYFENPAYEHLVFDRPTHRWTTTEILSLVRGPYFAPGTGYHYSNTNYVLLGEIVRRITGHPAATEIRARFLDPLGLDDEVYQGHEHIPVDPAKSYLAHSGGGWTDQSDGSRFRPNTSAATSASDAGAILGSARDIARWGRALYGGQLLRPETLAEMETPSRYEPYGLGVRRFTFDVPERVEWGHTGSLRGTDNIVWHLPSEGVTIAVLMNLGRVDPTPLARRLGYAVVGSLGIPAKSELPAPLDSSGLAADYQVEASLDRTAGTLHVSTTALVAAPKGSPVSSLALELAPLGLGRATMGPVTVRGAPVVPELHDQTIVVPLDPPLEPSTSIEVTIDYDATFATGTLGFDWLFSRAGGVFTAYRWIPWLTRERPFIGPVGAEPFVTPVAGSVDVAVTTDIPMKIAASGARVSVDGLRQVFRATDVRDFELTASTLYRTRTATVGGISLRAYGLSGADAAALLAEATRALPRLTAKLGAYRYPTLTVARTAGGLAIEAPAMVWIPATSDETRYLVTRELAHQWFFAEVGSDQSHDPFADEAPAEMAARSILGTLRASTCPAGRLDLRIDQYSDACYLERVTIDGANELDGIRLRMGDAPFWVALRGYLEAHRDRFGGTRELLDALDAGTPLSLRESYRLRFPRWY